MINYEKFFHRKLTHDMETTKVQLENERKIQQLQMQAINALWKKVSTLQTTTSETNGTTIVPNNSVTAVQDLAKTCSVLTNQVWATATSFPEIHDQYRVNFIGSTVAMFDFGHSTVHHHVL